MRVSPDIAPEYLPAGGDPCLPSLFGAARSTVARAWQHGQFWVTDPDCGGCLKSPAAHPVRAAADLLGL